MPATPPYPKGGRGLAPDEAVSVTHPKLTHRYRGQAPSHIECISGLESASEHLYPARRRHAVGAAKLPGHVALVGEASAHRRIHQGLALGQ
jgi:hypothetical protein